jgi:hypothetical protein
MSKPRNKGRGPGMTLLGVPMPGELKAKIQKAATLEDRKMADWARLKLRDAADEVLAKYMPAPVEIAKVAEDVKDYPAKKANGTHG